MAFKNTFNSVKIPSLPSNRFDLSHDLKSTYNAGNLYPILVEDAIPGDHWKINIQHLMRCAPFVAPLMHQVNVCIHTFFVPWRILWPNWEKHITSTKLPLGDIPLAPALIASNDPTAHPRLYDDMGIPKPAAGVSTNPVEFVCYHFAAYQKVYNDYYRDQNLITDPATLFEELLDGDNSSQWEKLTTLRRRAWEHDYFTSCLPFPQKGDPVSIPIGGFEDVNVYLNKVTSDTAWKSSDGFLQPSGTPTFAMVPTHNRDGSDNQELFAKTSDINHAAATINDLRVAFQLQRYNEMRALGGTRYNEFLNVMYRVNPGDARLQRPEYICGMKTPIIVSEVVQTSQTDTTPQGNMAGHGISLGDGARDSYFVREHGTIIAILSIMPKPAYQDGFDRKWFKFEPTDHYNNLFAHLGEQEVKNKELVAYTADDELTFGYQSRFAEYKYCRPRVGGDFKSSLSYWAWGRRFDQSAPQNLNQDFIECNPDYGPFAVTDPNVDHFWAHIFFSLDVKRPMPVYSTPSGL